MQKQLNSVETSYDQSIQRFDSALNCRKTLLPKKGEKEVTGFYKDTLQQTEGRGDTAKEMIDIAKWNPKIPLALNMSAISLKWKAQVTATRHLLSFPFKQKPGVHYNTYIPAQFSLLGSYQSLLSKLSTAAINEIGDVHQHRIHIENKDEFGKLQMPLMRCRKAQYFESSSPNKMLFENRAEAGSASLKRRKALELIKNDTILF